jgi:hypothetical protein
VPRPANIYHHLWSQAEDAPQPVREVPAPVRRQLWSSTCTHYTTRHARAPPHTHHRTRTTAHAPPHTHS